MRPEEARWLLGIVTEYDDEKLTGLVLRAFQTDRELCLLAPTSFAQPVDVLLCGQPIPDDLVVSWRQSVSDVHALVKRRSVWLARQRREAAPSRGRPLGMNAAAAERRNHLAGAIAAVWSYVAMTVEREADMSTTTVESPARVEVASFPKTLGCWVLRRRGLSYSEIAGRLRELVPGDVDDLRASARKYVRAADGLVSRGSAAWSHLVARSFG